MCLDSFRLFCKVFDDPEWFDDDFHGPLCDFLQNEDSPDKLVVMARTHLKTSIAVVRFSIWLATKWFYHKGKGIRILLVYNSADNAKKTLHQIRSFFETNELYKALYPEIIPDSLTSRSLRWNDECATLNRPEEFREGTFEAAGVGSNIISRHYDVIIEDDTVAPKKDQYTQEEVLPTLEEIEKAIGFHKLTIPLMIPPIEECRRITIGTRWASMDLIQYILDKELMGLPGGRYTSWNKSAIVDGKPAYKRFSENALASIRATMGIFMFTMLYLNEPLASEFLKFRPEWIRYYDDPDDPANEWFECSLQECQTKITIDPADAPTGKKSQDYSSMTAALHTSYGLFVRRIWRGRVSEGELVDMALSWAADLDAIEIRVEVDRYANLEAAFNTRMRQLGKYFHINPVKTRGRKKEARILRLAPLLEHGQIFLRRGMRLLENEMFQFPRGEHDDVLDALSWQVLEDFKLPEYRVEKEKKPYYPKCTFSFDRIVESLNRKRNNLPFANLRKAPIRANRWEGQSR